MKSDYSHKKLMSRMLSFLQPVRKTAAIACVVLIVKTIVEVLSVYFLSPAVSSLAHGLAPSRGDGFWRWLMRHDTAAGNFRSILIMMAITQIGLCVMTYLRSVWDTRLSMEAVYHIRGAVFDKLQHLGFSFHDKMTTGQLINRALGDLQAVRMFVNMSVLGTLDILVSVAAYMALLWLRSPLLMATALIPLPLWYLVLRRFGKKAQPIFRLQQEANDEMMTKFTENIYGTHVIKAFGTEKQEGEKYAALNRTFLDRLFSMIRLQASLMPTLKIITTVAHIGLFVLAGSLILKGRIQIGDLMILGVTMSTLLSKIQQVNVITEVYQKAIVSSRRLFEILDARAMSPLIKNQKPLRITKGEIRFHDVKFGYDHQKLVLKNINAVIAGQRLTAIVGPTGSGKTTFANLIARLYEPHSGAISIDGQELSEIDLKDLRRSVGYVFQETFLFSDTVRNNIRYGRRDVSDEMLRAAAKAALADEFIETLPSGYDTLIGERGVMLSGGQRQRLALARALVYDPPILILDDPTAALDATTELTLQSRLEPLFRGRTVIMIAHRISNVAGADHILVFENGQVTQNGTHRDLLSREGHYRAIVQMQQPLVAHGGR